MSDDILDKFSNEHLKLPVTFHIDKDSWIKECDKLTSKFNIGILIMLVMFIIIGLFAGFIIVYFFLAVALFLFVSNLKKMSKLKEYGDTTITLTKSGITCSKPEFENKEINYEKIKSLTKHNWGIELKLDSSSDKEPESLHLPNIINEYPSLENFFLSKNIKA